VASSSVEVVHGVNVFIAWCLIKHMDNLTIFYIYNFCTWSDTQKSVSRADYQPVI
jgi:hypothetical protein